MNPSTWRLPMLLAGLAVAVLAGCAAPAEMSAKQKEAYELRRYCEANHDDVARCTGFLGDH